MSYLLQKKHVTDFQGKAYVMWHDVKVLNLPQVVGLAKYLVGQNSSGNFRIIAYESIKNFQVENGKVKD